MNNRIIFRKAVLACALIPFAASAHAASVYIADANVTENISYPSDTVIFRPTQETGSIDYSISAGVTIEANYIKFDRLSVSNPEDYTYTYVDINSINIGGGSTLKASNSITIGYNLGPTTSAGALFDAGYSMYVNSSWNSTSDTVNTVNGFYLQGGTQTIDKLALTESGGKNAQTTFSGATVNISNSTLNLQGRFYVQSGANVMIKDSQTTLESYELSQISGGNLTIQGGSFNVVNSYEYSPRSFTVGGGSLVIDGAEVDTRGVVLSTVTSPSSSDAVITLKNGAILTAGALDLYTYDSAANTTVFNIESGSVANVEIFSRYGANRGGTINVDGGTLNVSDGIVQSEPNGSQIFTTKLNVTNGGKVELNGALDVASVVADGGTIIADSILVGEGRTLSVVGTSVIDTELLSVCDGSTVSLDSNSTLNIAALEVILSDLEKGTTYNLSDIFGDDTGIVLSAVESNITMSDMQGHSFGAIISEGGVITAVPEPATYAAIFGALALAFAAYRRRK